MDALTGKVWFRNMGMRTGDNRRWFVVIGMVAIPYGVPVKTETMYPWYGYMMAQLGMVSMNVEVNKPEDVSDITQGHDAQDVVEALVRVD